MECFRYAAICPLHLSLFPSLAAQPHLGLLPCHIQRIRFKFRCINLYRMLIRLRNILQRRLTMSALSDESAPLIRTESQVSDIDDITESHDFARPLSRRDVSTLLLTFAVFFLLCFAKYLVEVPIVQLFEQTACHQFYRSQYYAPLSNVNGSVFGEYDCKVPPVQDKLAKLVGWRIAFDAIPGNLFSP